MNLRLVLLEQVWREKSLVECLPSEGIPAEGEELTIEGMDIPFIYRVHKVRRHLKMSDPSENKVTMRTTGWSPPPPPFIHATVWVRVLEE